MQTITCVGESYHSTDPWEDHKPINLVEGESVEVSDRKAEECKLLEGIVEVGGAPRRTPRAAAPNPAGPAEGASKYAGAKYADLRKLAKERELDVPSVGASKDDLVAALEAADKAAAEAGDGVGD